MSLEKRLLVYILLLKLWQKYKTNAITHFSIIPSAYLLIPVELVI